MFLDIFANQGLRSSTHSLHPWYISRQIRNARGAPSNGGYELFPSYKHTLLNDIGYLQITRVRWSPSCCNSSS